MRKATKIQHELWITLARRSVLATDCLPGGPLIVVHPGHISGTPALPGPSTIKSGTPAKGTHLFLVGHPVRGRAGVDPLVAFPHGSMERESDFWVGSIPHYRVHGSRSGWGVWCGEFSTGGLWPPQEQRLHISCLELLAGSFAVHCWPSEIRTKKCPPQPSPVGYGELCKRLEWILKYSVHIPLEVQWPAAWKIL